MDLPVKASSLPLSPAFCRSAEAHSAFIGGPSQVLERLRRCTWLGKGALRDPVISQAFASCPAAAKAQLQSADSCTPQSLTQSVYHGHFSSCKPHPRDSSGSLQTRAYSKPARLSRSRLDAFLKDAPQQATPRGAGRESAHQSSDGGAAAQQALREEVKQRLQTWQAARKQKLQVLPDCLSRCTELVSSVANWAFQRMLASTHPFAARGPCMLRSNSQWPCAGDTTLSSCRDIRPLP